MIAYKKYLSEKGLAVSTLNLYIVAANSYLKYAGHEDCRVKTQQIQRRQSLENIISMEEYRRLLAYAKESGLSEAPNPTEAALYATGMAL